MSGFKLENEVTNKTQTKKRLSRKYCHPELVEGHIKLFFKGVSTGST